MMSFPLVGNPFLTPKDSGQARMTESIPRNLLQGSSFVQIFTILELLLSTNFFLTLKIQYVNYSLMEKIAENAKIGHFNRRVLI